MDTLEERLGRLEGVKSAKVRGYDAQSKFFFNLTVLENKSVVPATIRKMLDDLRKETKGDDDYGYKAFEITSMAGTVEKSGDAILFTARGSNLRFAVTPNDALRKLLEQGKKEVQLAGFVDDKEKLKIDVTDAKESAK